MLAPSRELVGDLTAGGSPVGEEKGIFPSPSSSDHDLANHNHSDHDHSDHVPSSSAE